MVNIIHIAKNFSWPNVFGHERKLEYIENLKAKIEIELGRYFI